MYAKQSWRLLAGEILANNIKSCPGKNLDIWYSLRREAWYRVLRMLGNEACEV